MRLLNAPAALMSRLTYARKFLLLGLVLLAPAAFALHAYWASQGATIEFARSERGGVRYVVPANQLVVALVKARGAADPAATAEVRRAVAAVDRADGSAIGTDAVWKRARPVILAARPAGSPQATFAAYDKAVAAALDL